MIHLQESEMTRGRRARRVVAIATLALIIGVFRQAAIGQQCVGDCAGAGSVTVTDLVTLVNVALGSALPSACLLGIPPGGQVNVALITQAVNNALNGCTEVVSAGGGLSSFITKRATGAGTLHDRPHRELLRWRRAGELICPLRQRHQPDPARLRPWGKP